MPGRDKTGPMCTGPMTGRKLGPCSGKRDAGKGAGLGLRLGLACRRGFGGRFRIGFHAAQKDTLLEQKSVLQKRLRAVEEMLEDL